MDTRKILPVIAAGLFLCGIAIMLFVVPFLGPQTQETTQPDTTQEPTWESTEPPTTEEPTEPPTTVPPTDTTPQEELGISAKYAFVYQMDHGWLLYAGGNVREYVAPASLTKLLTAYVVLEHMQEDTVVTVGEEVTWIDPYSSVAYLQPGHQLSVRMLVQGLLMQSGNDAAYTLAVACGRTLYGDETLDRRTALGVFMDEMNRTARELQLLDTHFMNPDGIDQEGHYTTVYDLIRLSKVVLQNQTIAQFCAMASADVVFHSGQTCTWYNSNYFLSQESEFYQPNVYGLKTGSTQNAGKCLLSLFRQEDGSTLLIGVLGSTLDEDRYAESLTLYRKFTTDAISASAQ